jgi:hypothetical protein
MGREARKLQEAFLLKEETKGFLANLEKLKKKGTVEQEQYDSIKSDYAQRLKEATTEITEIKVQLSQQLDDEKRERDNHKLELGNLETRFKVGELSLDSYQGQERKIRRKIEKIEDGMAELERLIKAKSSSGISEYADIPARKKGKALSTKRGRTRASTGVASSGFISSAEEIFTPKTKVVGMIGGLLLFISVFLNWKSTGEYFGVSFGISGSDVSGAITAFGIICGLICIGTALLANSRARGVLYMVASALSILIFVVVWFSSSILSEFEVVREGVFFYILPVVAIFIAGIVDFRRE